jgi:hypothetical protein
MAWQSSVSEPVAKMLRIVLCEDFVHRIHDAAGVERPQSTEPAELKTGHDHMPNLRGDGRPEQRGKLSREHLPLAKGCYREAVSFFSPSEQNGIMIQIESHECVLVLNPPASIRVKPTGLYVRGLSRNEARK